MKTNGNKQTQVICCNNKEQLHTEEYCSESEIYLRKKILIALTCVMILVLLESVPRTSLEAGIQ